MQHLARRMTPAPSLRVCFLTDVEGNWSYVQRVVRQSSCLRFADASERRLALHDDALLVFGGDAGDKGDDTLHCYEELVRLKREHPDRVVLLVGNRDVNKLRFTSELHDSEMSLHAMAREIYDGPVWVPRDRRTTLPQFLAGLAGAGGDVEAVNTKVNRLQWMLEHTMGCQGEFERRRRELQARSAAAKVSDQDVLASFIDSVAQPSGALREYLEHGALAFLTHDTLFLHGGVVTSVDTDGRVTAGALGRVPGSTLVFADVREWVDALNAWYQQELDAWRRQPTWTEDRSSRGGNALLEYVLPSHRESVVMGRHLDRAGMPVALPPDAVAWLSANGVRRLLIGHTPHGNSPTVVKQPAWNGQCPLFEEVVMSDTSYSDMSASDNRGIAASEVVVQRGGAAVAVRGVLQDGRPIAYESTDPLIGRRLRDGTQVKARLADVPDEFLVFRVENGFSYTYHYRSRDDVERIGLQDDA
ncbi:hypothetical protein ATCC90586_007575 [Pythium insidiosum]|nr:hypothetical protein ATCC90586_007575 [Pythium insidiosum]